MYSGWNMKGRTLDGRVSSCFDPLRAKGKGELAFYSDGVVAEVIWEVMF
jgi:hypothetical protein